MRFQRTIAPLFLVLFAASSAPPLPFPPPSRAVDPALDFAGPRGSGKPSLSRTGSGGLLATWFEPKDSTRFALRIAERRGQVWSVPVTVVERDNFFVNWADFPTAVETSDGRWVVHWLEKTAAKSYAYHIRVSVSRDQGKTWTLPVTPHTDRSETEHGFVAMLPRANGEGGADLLWLDGRQTGTGGGSGGMAIATGSVGSNGQAGSERMLDLRVCDCCQTALARTSEGLIAVYRDRSDSEVRDIAIVRQVKRGGEWSAPRLVASDGWVYRACPVNGPSVAADARRVAIAWFTEAAGQPRVSLAWSSDAGASFGSPVRIDDGTPIGRSEVELTQGGAALVIWLERVRGGDQAEWRVKQVAPDGRVTGRWTLAAVPASRAAGFTRAAVVDRTLFVAWTAPDPDGGIRIHRVSIP